MRLIFTHLHGAFTALLIASLCTASIAAQSNTRHHVSDDARNTFIDGVRRFVSLSHTTWKETGNLWLSTSWTYAPDSLDHAIHDSRILFGYADSHTERGFFILTLTATRGDVDPLEQVNIMSPGANPEARRQMNCHAMAGHSITGGFLAASACRIAEEEMLQAQVEGMTLRHVHASGHKYTLSYPAEFFRAIQLGINQSGPATPYGKRLLGYMLTGRTPAPSKQPHAVFDTTRARNQDAAATAFMSALGPVLSVRHGLHPRANRHNDTATSRTNWTRRKLPGGVSLELGADWSIVDEEVLSIMNAEMPQSATRALYGATLYGVDQHPRCSVYLYSDTSSTYGQDLVRAMTQAELAELDSELQATTVNVLHTSGANLVAWMGVRRVQLDGVLALVATYTRSCDNPGQIRLVRGISIYAAHQSCRLSISSYGCSSESDDALGGRIINSLRFQPSASTQNPSSFIRRQPDTQTDALLLAETSRTPTSADARGNVEQERFELRGHNGWVMMELGKKIGGARAIQLLAQQGVTYLTTPDGLRILRQHGIATDYWASERAKLHCKHHANWLDTETRAIWNKQRSQGADHNAQHLLSADDQVRTGLLYYAGEGVIQNYKTAFEHFRQAAEQGDARGQYNLGHMYDLGKGVIANTHEAVKWYRKAAAQGHASAQHNLGYMYEEGEGVPKNAKQAAAYYLKAAKQNHASAQHNLGFLYLIGNGVKQSAEQAEYWLRKSAEQGETVAQYNLGCMYAKGDGVERDAARALAWFTVAASSGDSSALRNKSQIAASLTSKQLAEAQRLTSQIKETLNRRSPKRN